MNELMDNNYIYMSNQADNNVSESKEKSIAIFEK